MSARTDPATIRVTVRYFAGAAAAAGTAEESFDVPRGATTRDVVQTACERRGTALTRAARACSVLLDGVLDRDRAGVPGPGATLDVLPPFAGG